MPLSGFQAEALLDGFWKRHLPASVHDPESPHLSDESRQTSRARVPARARPASGWVMPQDILRLVEDTSEQTPAVTYERLRRAGRFLDPEFIPENPLPPFTRVRDYLEGHRRRRRAAGKEGPEMESSTEEDLEIPVAEELEAGEASVQEELSEESLEIPVESEIAGDDSEGTVTSAAALSEEFEEEPLEEEVVVTSVEEVSAANLLDVELPAEDLDELDDLEELEGGKLGLAQVTDDEADVVFGNGEITAASMALFVGEYPDSALKFLLRRDIDGRPLPREHEEIHRIWEDRGMRRPLLLAYILRTMGWEEMPDMPIHEILGELRGRLFDLSRKKR